MIAWFGSSVGCKQLLHCCFLPSPLVPLALPHQIRQGWCHCQGRRVQPELGVVTQIHPGVAEDGCDGRRDWIML